MTAVRRDARWNAGLAGTLALVGLGLAYANPTLVAAAAVPLTYVLYGAFSSLPGGAALDLTRRFDPAAPAPGERVTVALTVENAGDRTLPDVRVVDGVPATLAVEAGSPRAHVSLAPGESATLSYEVTAVRGDFAFDDALIRLRSTAGTSVATTEASVGGDAVLTCAGTVADAPVPDATPGRVGTVPADSGGSGLEFHATREYRPGDALSRVDWRHLAKTGELTTVEFREQQASAVTIVVDARRPARVVAGPGRPTAAELCVYAASRAHRALTAADHDVSATVLGLGPEAVPDPVPTGSDGLPWPGGPRETRAVFESAGAAAAETVTTSATDERVPAADGGFDPRAVPSEADAAAALDARAGSDARVVVFSPLLDDYPAALASALRSRGRPVAVLSPDVTGEETPGLALASLDRTRRRTELERTGTAVADWTPERPLDDPLERALNR